MYFIIVFVLQLPFFGQSFLMYNDTKLNMFQIFN